MRTTKVWEFYIGSGLLNDEVIEEKECQAPSKTKSWRELVRKFEHGQLPDGYTRIGYRIKETKNS